MTNNDDKKIAALYRLSLDQSTTEPERKQAGKALERELARLGLTMTDAERIAAEQTTTADEQDIGCTPHEMVMVVMDLLRQYVWHPNDDVYLIAALWVLHTHVYRQFRHTPRCLVYAPLSNSGKSTLMTVMRFLSAGGHKLDDPSSASLFRAIDEGINKTGRYSKFIDEMDNAEFDKTFHRIYNNGFLEGGQVNRTIGKDTVSFDVFAPLCFGSISKSDFTPQNLNRSFLIKMHKKGSRKLSRTPMSEIYPSEDIIDVRYLIDDWARSVGGNDSLEGKLERFPAIPAALIDRDEDRWRPLLSIADATGYGDETRRAATSSLFAIAQADLKVDLMLDIRKVFDGLKPPRPADRIWSVHLAEELHDLHEAPWGGEWCGLDGKKQPHRISAGEIGRLLRNNWEIQSGSIRIGETTKKGWYRKNFEQAWSDVGLPSSTALAAQVRSSKRRSRRPQTHKRHNGHTTI